MATCAPLPPAIAEMDGQGSSFGAQRAWAAVGLKERLKVVRRFRHLIADSSRGLAASVPLESPAALHRNLADTLVAEVLPLAEACRFLEQEAGRILRPRKIGARGRPFWLRGTSADVFLDPVGVVLILAPSNYPLLLPGVQCVQALAAGNAVLWKPARCGVEAARMVMELLRRAGLPEGLLTILDDAVESGLAAIRVGVDKVFVTGHEETGRSVMRVLAETVTPSVMELSGCDAVFLLDGADLERVAHALAFGMRLNGSATCMAPRRVFADAASTEKVLRLLLPKLQTVEPVRLAVPVRKSLDALLSDAVERGARVVVDGRQGDRVFPTILGSVPPGSMSLQTDIFAPLLSFCLVASREEALAADALCPYALTAAVFGTEKEVAGFAKELRAGNVLINDLIVSTADPRISFGGRGASGFGKTRGREGLLEMTVAKTVLRQRSKSLRAYAQTTEKHEVFFASYIEAAHAGTLRGRQRGLRQLLSSARDVEK